MQNLKTVDLCDIPVRVDGEMVCLTDMWRASGSERKNRAVEFLRNDKTAAFVSVLEKVGNPTFYTESGRNGGTWSHKLIAYKYAAWINLQRSWRPLVMLVFTALVVCRWMGWASPDLSEALELKLLGIVQLGIGGYIASRGVEKVVHTIKR